MSRAHAAKPLSPEDYENIKSLIREVNGAVLDDLPLISAYDPEPTPAEFHQDNAFFRGIRGPVGSGKSVACVTEIWFRAWDQAPDSRGIRRTRFAVIRNTTPELKSTTIKTFQEFIPESMCRITYTAPITGRMIVKGEDGTSIDCEIFFLALDIPKDVRKLKSLELTGGFINEASEVEKPILDMLCSRVGRYPSKRMVELTWCGVWADTNAMDEDHWWYRLAEGEEDMDDLVDPKYFPPGMDPSWRFYEQPAALLKVKGKYVPNPEAENARHQQLGFAYWLQQVKGKSKDWISAYLLNEYATVFDGRPIYSDFSNFHVSQDEFWPIKGANIVLGWDFGLTPSCVVLQRVPYGPIRVIAEFTSDRIGLRPFIRNVVKPGLHELEIDWKKRSRSGTLVSIGDPAGVAGNEIDETNAFDCLYEEGIYSHGAMSNRFMRRIESVIFYLTTMVGGVPSLQIAPSCKRLIKGFRGGYHYRRLQVPGKDPIFKTAPEKNLYSHPHDALQYAMMYYYYDEDKQATIGGSDVYQPIDRETGI